MGTQGTSNVYMIDDRRSKKVCRRGLTIYSSNCPKRFTLPKLPGRPASPAANSASTWDELIPNEKRIIQDVPLSEQCIQDQDAHFSEPAYSTQVVLYAAVNAVRGESSQFVQWDYESMRLIAQHVRMESISSAATTDMLQDCANVGSYIRRLRYVVARIESLQANQVLLALASAIEDELDKIIQMELDSYHILALLRSVQEPASTAYLLARIVGCADLSLASELRSLPSTVHLLNTAYNEMLRVQLEPAKYDVLWRIVGRTTEPWLAQLNRMLGSDPSIFSIPTPKMIQEFLPDIFIMRKGPFFALDKSRLPKFMPSSIAELAVECLNCGLILKYQTPELQLPIAWFPCDHISRSLGFKYGMSPDPFNPKNLESQYKAPHLFIPNYTPKAPESTIFELFQPIEQRHSVLNDAAMMMLLYELDSVTLNGHADILLNVFCLKDGRLFATLQDNIEILTEETDAAKWELAADFVKEALIDAIKQLHLPQNCVKFNFKRIHENGASPVFPEYVVPAPVNMIVTPEIVQQSSSIFQMLVQLQTCVQVSTRGNDRDELQRLFGKLFDISIVISVFSNELRGYLDNRYRTLAGLINAFNRISNVAMEIRHIVDR